MHQTQISLKSEQHSDLIYIDSLENKSLTLPRVLGSHPKVSLITDSGHLFILTSCLALTWPIRQWKKVFINSILSFCLPMAWDKLEITCERNNPVTGMLSQRQLTLGKGTHPYVFDSVLSWRVSAWLLSLFIFWKSFPHAIENNMGIYTSHQSAHLSVFWNSLTM